MRKYVVRVCVSLLLIIVCSTFRIEYQAAQTVEKIRVGVFDMDGFHYYDEKGRLTGYCIEYLEVLEKLAGWEYEYVPVADFMDGCQKVESGEIDLIAPAVITDERRQHYAYSEISIGVEYTALLTNADVEDLYYEDFARFNDLKIAVLSGYPLTEYFIAYMARYDFQAELVYFDTVEESYAALKNGQVDAMVDSIMNIRDDQKLLAKFTPQAIYFLMNKENTVLQREFNKAMFRVQETYPTLLDELLTEYYPTYDHQHFTREEAEYIDQEETLKVAYVSDRKPLSFTDKNGELAGISREIFDRISEISGLKFEFVELPEGFITYQYLLEQGIDLITGVEYNNANMNVEEILMSRPYLSARKVMVSQEEFHYKSSGRYKVAVVSGSQTIHEELYSAYPNLEIIYYETNAECFEALHKKEVDMLLQNQYVVEGLLAKPVYSNFMVVPVDGLDDELCFSTIVSDEDGSGMDKEERELVISILNKSISQLTDKELDNIVVRETLGNPYELSLMDFLYSYRYGILFLSIVGMIGGVFWYIYNRQQKKIQLIKDEENRRNLLQQKRYEKIIECSDDLIYEISLNGEFCVSSEKIKEKFGWEIPKKVEDLDIAEAMNILHVHPDDEAVFRKSMLTSGAGKFEEQILRVGKADGSYIWCKVSRTLLMDENQKVVSILGKITDIDEEVKEKQTLELRSKTDPLTGLLNKVSFEKEVRHYIEKHSIDSACFVFLDMDHFKDINDIFGHNVGDQVIKETAKKVQLLFANFDLVSRFGGDEFCVFVKEIPRATLIDRLKFAVKKMEQEYPYVGGVVKVSASIGAAYCRKGQASYKELLEIADEALYQAKDNGRNCYIIKDIE